MWNTFKYSLFSLSRSKDVLIWVVVFPIALATMFLTIAGIEDGLASFDPIPTAVVEDTAYREAPGFADMLDKLSRPGDQLLDLTRVGTAEEAQRLLWSGDIIGYLIIDSAGDLQVIFSANTSASSGAVGRTVLKDIADSYLRVRSTLDTVARQNPQVLANPQVLERLTAQTNFTQQISLSSNKVSIAVRYYYALLGFLAIMTGNISFIAITRTQPNLSALGARRTLGATSRFKTITATLAASWLLGFIGLCIGFAYIRLVLRIDFGGNDLACLLAFVAASLMATSFGLFIGLIPKLGEKAKGGIMTGLSSVFSLLAGLYGEPSMRLADSLTRTAPWLQAANPVKQVTNLFYSLYYYDSYDPFIQGIVTLLIITAVLFVFALLLMRRQSYASI